MTYHPATAAKTLPLPKAASLAEIEAFCTGLSERLRAEHAKTYRHEAGTWYAEGTGKRYVRVIHDRGTGLCAKSCYAFIERETGYVYKPDGWKKPAKHARGAIHDISGFECCGLYGVAYLR